MKKENKYVFIRYHLDGTVVVFFGYDHERLSSPKYTSSNKHKMEKLSNKIAIERKIEIIVEHQLF